MDQRVRFRTSDRRAARPPDTPRPYPGDERRELPARPLQASGAALQVRYPARRRGIMMECDLIVAEAGTKLQVTETSRGLGGARYWGLMKFRGGAAFGTGM